MTSPQQRYSVPIASIEKLARSASLDYWGITDEDIHKAIPQARADPAFGAASYSLIEKGTPALRGKDISKPIWPRELRT